MVMESTNNNKNYEAIGRVLRLAREDLQLSLASASRALHIRAHYLHALEVGELEKLPSAAYTKGYLQSYATFLHLDKDEILRRFEQVKNTIPERGYFFPQVFSKEKKPTSAIVWGGLGLASFIYIIWLLAFKPALPPAIIVEPLPSTPVKPTELFVFDASCALPDIALYPPCYYKENGGITTRTVNSVMELSW